MAILKNSNRDKFTIVDNVAVRDDRISLKALGLLVRLLSLPDNWEFSEDGLIAIFKQDGQASIRSGLKELERMGYLVRKRQRDDKGRISSVEWTVFENPYLGNPSLDNSNLENRPQYNTYSIKEEKKERCNDKHGYGEFENVLLTEEERAKLDEKLGDLLAPEYIERLSGYLASNGKRYKSHYAAILNWWRKDGQPVKRTPPVYHVQPEEKKWDENTTAADIF